MMRGLLNKGFEALGRREEKREARMDALLTSHVNAMSNRGTLNVYASVLGGISILFWVAVLLRPHDILAAFEKVGSVNDRLVGAVLALVFAIGMRLTYSLFRLKFPDLEDRSQAGDVMSSYADWERMSRNLSVWVASVSGGVINLLALAVTEGLLIS